MLSKGRAKWISTQFAVSGSERPGFASTAKCHRPFIRCSSRSITSTGAVTRLFHPPADEWNSHFRRNGADIVALSQAGRVTVSVLFVDDPEVVWLRSTLAAEYGPRTQ